MNDDRFSEILVFDRKGQWFNIIFALFSLIIGILFIWSEILYLSAGHPSNIDNNFIYKLLWENPDDLDLSRFQYRLVCYFPFMIFFCAYNLFTVAHNVFFTKLIIGQEGIEYYAPGYCVKAKWSDVEKIGKKRFLFWSTEGLFLQASFYTKNWSWFPIAIFTFGKNFIPLDYFNRTSSQMSARELINQYLNHQKSNDI